MTVGPLAAGTQITRFMGYWRPLSNFYPCAVVGNGGYTYPTVEHAYHAAKIGPGTAPAVGRKWLEDIQKAQLPGVAKALGRRLPCRSDWDAIRLDVMRGLLTQKFALDHPDQLYIRLQQTGDAYLIEGNTWGDRFWGMTMGETGWAGENHLGKLLMEVREGLKRG